MATSQVKIEGLDEVIRELERRNSNLREALQAIVLAGAEVIRQAAAGHASGKIAAGMVKEPLTKSAKRVEVGIGPSKKQWYARFTEFGTKAHAVKLRRAKALNIGGDAFRASMTHPGTKARPFLRPAFDERQGDASDAMSEEVKRVLEL